MNCEIIGKLFLIWGENRISREGERSLSNMFLENFVYTRLCKVYFYLAKCFSLLSFVLIVFQKENVLLWTTTTCTFSIH